MRVPTTWKRDGIVHEVTLTCRMLTGLDKATISFRTTCGIYERVDDERAFACGRSVGCIDCLTAPNLEDLDELRQRAPF